MRKILNSLQLQFALLGLFTVCLVAGASAQTWKTVGPFGGDARSFAYSPTQPARILLGTTNGWIYQSDDNGAHWDRLSKIAPSDNLVVDHILFDESNPKRLLVGAWMLGRPQGGIYISQDDGQHWSAVADMDGQSVRALAQAPSNPKIFVAGTLKGIYRSEDGGQHWALISPPNSMEIHEVESIAIDPVNPDRIYAGTWHLPWKTTDGGKTWQNIKQGLIDDSDVFSIIIDPSAPDTVFASACSGIYKSLDAGQQFHKVQGIPSTARRTRVLKQDPANRNVVYAGTTEGLYRTTDGGTKWSLLTPKSLIINDVYIDPKNSQHVVLATDRSGVLTSDDGAQTFHDSNSGFSQRHVAALVVDRAHPGTMYVGVVNDKQYGGVFASRDAGQNWQQQSNGLDGHDVFALAISPGGSLLAGTNDGIYHWTGSAWENSSNRLKDITRKVTHVKHRHRTVTTETIAKPDGKIEASVHGLAFSDGEWYAASSEGIYRSDDKGFLWHGGPVLGAQTFSNVAARSNTVVANAGTGLYVSTDQGKTWQAAVLPAGWHRVRHVAVDGDGHLWVAGRLGVASSADNGQTWQPAKLPVNNISAVQYDPQLGRVVVTSYDSDLVFGIQPSTNGYIWWNPGWRTHAVRSSDGRLVAATLFHGVVLQPEKHGTESAAASVKAAGRQ